jgi:hypothetical protein
MTTYKTTKAFEVCEVVMNRRGIAFTEADNKLMTHVFEETAQYRRG